MATTIRALIPNDVDAYVALRVEMLQESPLSFGASFETDVACDVDGMRKRLEAPEPRSLQYQGEFYDEIYMLLELT